MLPSIVPEPRTQPGQFHLHAAFTAKSPLLLATAEYRLYRCGVWLSIADRLNGKFYAARLDPESFTDTRGRVQIRYRVRTKDLRAVPGLLEVLEREGVFEGCPSGRTDKGKLYLNRVVAALAGLHKQYGFERLVYRKGRRHKATNVVVHHLNHDPADDRIENLAVMTELLHERMHDVRGLHDRRPASLASVAALVGDGPRVGKRVEGAMWAALAAKMAAGWHAKGSPATNGAVLQEQDADLKPICGDESSDINQDHDQPGSTHLSSATTTDQDHGQAPTPAVSSHGDRLRPEARVRPGLSASPHVRPIGRRDQPPYPVFMRHTGHSLHGRSQGSPDHSARAPPDR